MHSTGFCVPWTVSASWSRLEIDQSVVCLRSARPVALLADGVPAGLVLPVIVAATDDQPLLGPDDLGADGEPFPRQAFRNGRCVKRAMPDVGDGARKQCP